MVCAIPISYFLVMVIPVAPACESCRTGLGGDWTRVGGGCSRGRRNKPKIVWSCEDIFLFLPLLGFNKQFFKLFSL
jgi:hypothetical protein